MIAAHNGRLVKTTGDGLLVEFGSVVDGLRCATAMQTGMAERNAPVGADKRIEFRIGINMGDLVVEDGDIFGDGVNVAARLEALTEPGGICVSARVKEDAIGRLDLAFEDLGEQALKNIARPVRAYKIATDAVSATARETPAPALPDKPSIAVLPFQNMTGDAEQEYFVDGMVEEIITALSRIRWLFVIARNSSFTYKDQKVDVKRIGRELGVRYVLETAAGLSQRAGAGLDSHPAKLQDAGVGAVAARKPRRLRTNLKRVASGLPSPAMAYLASSPPAGGRPALYEKGRISATNYGEKVLLFHVRRKTTWDYSRCQKRRRQARRVRFAPHTIPSGLAP